MKIKYLGVIISSDGRMKKEVEARIGSATRVIGGMNETVLKRKELSRSIKLKVENVTMIPTLLYGCETWCLSKHLQSRVQATQMNVLRWIEGVSRLDRIYKECGHQGEAMSSECFRYGKDQAGEMEG